MMAICSFVGRKKLSAILEGETATGFFITYTEYKHLIQIHAL